MVTNGSFEALTASRLHPDDGPATLRCCMGQSNRRTRAGVIVQPMPTSVDLNQQ